MGILNRIIWGIACLPRGSFPSSSFLLARVIHQLFMEFESGPDARLLPASLEVAHSLGSVSREE